ncbi:enoyl-CoA hydratase/isomerase family protein [Flammeovirga sp. EKP202]|uniref:enoyl-CoA hydratase/isomerase family protein n=1 Tax=Flammeovirga sp. EKP202 TaxID=2770592 RepID=UPI00165EEC0B|nr:enoyl-CoA hydratase/isomerase family protein [Flammeovirga sp. EKP202]MBD0401691.1 enoyl-CoA hydratase/isomerase family protein [Flammeovirga sp. EKP202]
MKNIFSSRKGNVVTIYLPNQCLNELSNDNTMQIINEINVINDDTSVDMVIFRTIQENFFLKQSKRDENKLVIESDYFISLKEKVQNMRPMTVSIVEGTTNMIGSEFIKASDLSYATEEATFANGFDLQNQSLEQYSAQKAEDLGIITRYVPSDKIDITLDYLLHTYE